jgi:nitrate/nitrite-specific signal transduction histidine kinase
LESVFNVSCRFRCRADRQSTHLADPAIAIQLYRIAQESATNAVKHGRAKEICISISMDKGRMKLTIADDGVGIGDVLHSGGMGLPVMYQRARVIGAALTISKRRQGGTLVTCTLSGRPSVPAHGRNTQKRAPRGRVEKSTRTHKAHGYAETSIETFSQVAHDIIC